MLGPYKGSVVDHFNIMEEVLHRDHLRYRQNGSSEAEHKDSIHPDYAGDTAVNQSV